jgi:heme ABC exporter ATP-binding subunit CcmA
MPVANRRERWPLRPHLILPSVSPIPVHAIALQDIAHRFGRRWALRGVSLTVPRGEVLALLGHNGSGKSTLLRVASTVIRPTRGQGTIYGVDIVRQAATVRAMIALLSTDPGVYGDLTAFENLHFAARMLGVLPDPLALRRALDRVGLGRDEHELARNMSSGMQRRLSIARLLLREPQLLFLDEPYNSLDTEGAALVNALIRETRARGGTVLLVAHDIARAEGLPDRTVTIEDGVLIGDTRASAQEGDQAHDDSQVDRSVVDIERARRVTRGAAHS